MGRNIIETVLGAVVLVVAAFFLTFALKTADVSKIPGYSVSANFPRADGLKNGGDVMVNGVKVGTVLGQELITAPGKDQFLVKVTMSIDSRVQLPTDTVAMIANESLLGGRYLSLEIGVDEENIRTDGTGRIFHTQPPLRLDDLIGKLMFSPKSEDKKDSGTKTPTPQKAADDDYSYGSARPEVAPANPEPTKVQVIPVAPERVEEVIKEVLPKKDAVKNDESKFEEAVPTNSDPIKKDDPARRHYDARTWYDLQKNQELKSVNDIKAVAPKPTPLLPTAREIMPSPDPIAPKPGNLSVPEHP